MQDILKNLPEEKQTTRAWITAITIIAYVSLFMFFNTTGDVDVDSIKSFDPSIMLIAQAFGSLIMFVGAAFLFSFLLLKFNALEFFPKISLTSIGLTFAIAISFIVVISVVGEWNMNLDFGDSDFAKWARRSEDQLKVLTEYLTSFSSPTHYLLGLFAIAVIPAIGEELLFRGLIQNLLVKAFKNHHLAIWVTGFIFAAIHMQFFGLAPRMMLGVLFGYMYHWSGKLTIAMLAHFINNGLALTALYMAQINLIEVSPEDMDKAAPWPAVLVFGLIAGYCLHVFHRKHQAYA